MDSQKFHIHEFENGLVLAAQPMSEVSSVSFSLSVPLGASYDPDNIAGSASVLAEWCMRGAGEKDSRQLNEALDSIGCQHSQSVKSHHITYSMALLGRNLEKAMDLLSDIVLRPHFDDSSFQACRELISQDLESLEDEPSKKANQMLRERFFPSPLGRCIYGNPEALGAMKPQTVREHWRSNIGSDNSILAVAGNFNWEQLLEQTCRHFTGWKRQKYHEPAIAAPLGGHTHIKKDSAQTHITLAHKSITSDKPEYYTARVAEMILSGGMSSRLFTEVREKRGLAYHVSTQYLSLKNQAGMFTYAGTVPQKAQETFEVTVNELIKISEGVTAQELTRAKTQLKSALVMQGESTISRSSALAGDWYYLGKLRTLNDISQAIDNITMDDVVSYVRQWPAGDFTILVIGPEMIKL